MGSFPKETRKGKNNEAVRRFLPRLCFRSGITLFSPRIRLNGGEEGRSFSPVATPEMHRFLPFKDADLGGR